MQKGGKVMDDSIKKGIINIRRLSNTSLGLTLPQRLVEHVYLQSGVYSYSALRKDDGTVEIKLRFLDRK
jgi:hypothetical protein